MIEREMEDLISTYPSEFFPRKELTFVNRQGSFPEVGRYDLLFSDRFGNQILIELKRVPVKAADADQLVRYHEALIASGHRNVILWIVAPTIPKQTEDFLDRYGIEHSVIHEAEFRQVATRHNYIFESENKSATQAGDNSPSSPNGWHSSVRDTFAYPTGNGKTANEKEFLERCDEQGKWFFSTLFDKQRALPTKTKITWNHESGFSIQFYFLRVGFVPFVWGFPSSNLDGKPRKQRLEFPFHFAKRQVSEAFINEFGKALAAVVALNTGKKPGIDINNLSKGELEQLLATIVGFAERASTYRAA
jgi:hypothetical protein